MNNTAKNTHISFRFCAGHFEKFSQIQGSPTIRLFREFYRYENVEIFFFILHH